MLRTIIKYASICFVIELILFASMIVTSVTDEKPPLISHFFYWTLKYIFGFPLVFLNNNYPYFLDGTDLPAKAIFLILLNNVMLAFSLTGILSLWKKRAVS